MGIEEEMILYISMFLGMFFIWYILDFALVFYGVKKNNCEIILAYLNSLDKK